MDKIEIKISERTKRIMLYTMLFMVVIHGYRFVSLGFSHDSLAFMAQSEFEWKISLGRFVQPLYWKIRGVVAAPYVVGIMSTLWLVLTAVMVDRVLELRTNAARFLIAGILASSTALIATNGTYIHEGDTFMLAFFLSAAAAWCCVGGKKRYAGFAVPLLVLSAGLYQAYLQTFTALVMIWAVLKILRGKPVQDVFVRCVISTAALLAALVLYSAAFKWILSATGIQANAGYNGLTEVGNYEGFNIVGLLKETFSYPFQYMSQIKGKNITVMKLGQMFVLLYGLLATGYVLLKKRMTWLPAVSAAGILCLLPLGINCIYFISKGLVYDQMVHSYSLVNVYAVAVSEYAWQLHKERDIQVPGFRQAAKTAMLWAMPAVLCVMFFDRGIFANQMYLKRQLEYESTQAIMIRVLDRLEQLDGYTAGETPVQFVGSMTYSPLNVGKAPFKNQEMLRDGHRRYALSYDDTYWWYIEDVMGYPMVRYEGFGDNKPMQQAANQMPVFPAKGSVQMIDGVAVVHLAP